MSYCIDLVFTKIGDNCDKSGSRKVELNFKNVSEDVTNSIMNSEIFTDNTVIVNQEQNIAINGSCCSNLDISQVGVVKVIDVTKVNVEMAVEIGNKIKNQIKKQLSDNQSKLNSFLGNKNGEKLTTLIDNSVSKITKKDSFKNSVIKSLTSSITNQTQNININCSEELPMPNSKGGNCVLSQSFLIESSVNNMIEVVMKDLIVDQELNEFINEIDNSYKIELPTLRKKYWYEENIDNIKLFLLFFITPLIIRLLYNIIKPSKSK